MIKALQILLVKGYIALLIAAYAVCVVGGTTANQPEWIRSGWKIAQNRGRPGMANEGATGEPDPNEIQSLRQRAEAGDAQAQRILGSAYSVGKEIPQNYEEAAKWFRRAAEQGDDMAQCRLAIMYSLGNGVPQNYAKAIDLSRQAAMRGNVLAQFFMGGLHALGRGVPQNYREAYVWYSIAAANGFDTTAEIKNLSIENKNLNAGFQRDLIADKLSPADLSAAQAEATRLHAEIRKNLEESGATD